MTIKTIRKLRSKAKLSGNTKPVLIINKSNAHTSAQVYDPVSGKTLFGATTATIKSGSKTEKAAIAGQSLADAAKAKKINQLVVNRNGYVYHGRVKTLIEAVRNHGITI